VRAERPRQRQARTCRRSEDTHPTLPSIGASTHGRVKKLRRLKMHRKMRD